jgi:hypothetical protein
VDELVEGFDPSRAGDCRAVEQVTTIEDHRRGVHVVARPVIGL